ncbi:MAG: hypothetical protein AAGK10_21240, partial [Cyanobacteria bacterium J06555_3]
SGYSDRPARGYDNSPRRPNYSDGYGDDPYGNTDAYPPRREAPRKGRGSRDSYPPQDPYNGRNSSRRDTYSNDWDDDDDEWF